MFLITVILVTASHYIFGVCCDFIYRKKSASASVAMEHMIPDLLISEKVKCLQSDKYSLTFDHSFSVGYCNFIYFVCALGTDESETM